LLDKILLFVSTGRTGTKTLANFFKDTFPNVTSVHQPPYSRFINVFSNMYLSNCLPESFLRRFVSSYKFPQVLGLDSDVYVEANTMNYIIAPYFEELGVDLHVVHVIRDPRDWVTSYINWVEHRAFSKIADSIVPFWHANGFLTGDLSLKDWLGMDFFEKMCWYWHFENKVILNRCRELHSFMSIKFEELIVKKDVDILNTILGNLGVSYSDDYLKYFDKKQNVGNKKYFDKWMFWSKKQCKILNSICGDLMEVYGYGLESTWMEMLDN
jgi:hypothetical protein